MTTLAVQPNLIHYLPLATTLIAAVFFSVLVQRYRAKGEGVPLLWWAAGDLSGHQQMMTVRASETACHCL